MAEKVTIEKILSEKARARTARPRETPRDGASRRRGRGEGSRARPLGA